MFDAVRADAIVLQITVSETKLDRDSQEKLERRRNKLFKRYRNASQRVVETRSFPTGRVRRIAFEEYKKQSHGQLLRSLLPRQFVSVPHQGPLTILAFSDYRTQDFEPLFRYIDGLGKRLDLIVYAGDDVERFGPIPSGLLDLPSSSEEYPKELDAATISYGIGSISSSRYGLVLRLPKYMDSPDAARLLSLIHI